MSTNWSKGDTSRLRVLLFSLPSGGIGHYTYCLADALQRNGANATVMLQDYPRYDLEHFPHTHKVKTCIRYSRSNLKKLWQAVPNLSTGLHEASQTDIFHCQWSDTPKLDRMFWQALKRMGKRIVYTAHNVVPHDRSSDATKHLIWMQRNADAIIVHGHKLKMDLLAQSGISADKVHVIQHGNSHPIVDQLDTWDRQSARQSFSLDDNEPVILFFGLMRPSKGLDVLIEACAALLRQDKKFKLMIAGPAMHGWWEAGEYSKRLRDGNLEDKTITDIDYVPMADIGRYFHAADVIAMPYRSGSQSGILQLAYAYAKPAVVTNVGSICEVVEDGKTGVVVPPNDAVTFAEALGNLIDDPERAKRIGRQGRYFAETELSWDAISAKTQEV